MSLSAPVRIPTLAGRPQAQTPGVRPPEWQELPAVPGVDQGGLGSRRREPAVGGLTRMSECGARGMTARGDLWALILPAPAARAPVWHPSGMPRYSAFVALSDGPGRYQELEDTIEAEDPRAAAQRAIDLAAIHPDDQFPVILIVEERDVSVFSRDDAGKAVTSKEDFPRLLAKGPNVVDVHMIDAVEVLSRSA
jgi:hypothetical protein